MIDIIRRPIVTEKAMRNQEQGQYVFEVDPHSNKIQIKHAIEKMFEVNIISIRTARVKGKIKSRFTRKGIQQGKTAMKKKAFITLKQGQTIDIVGGAAGVE
ncbi:MAG: 50S ribosomal protein L23 [Bacteroidetes bacterium]|nr:MAG: 50S ribosomal protein L23 [Bacteroidota bacterium]